MTEWEEERWRELEDEAWEHLDVGNTDEAARLALKAIALEPDAADAYVIVAQVSNVLGEKIAFAREAMRIGQAAFAEKIAAAPSEDFTFWSRLETRPYMRAIHTLALALSEDKRPGALNEAIELSQHALRICPNDNIGFRFLLSKWLAATGRWTEGYKMLKTTADEHRTEMMMWLALYAFQAGDLERAEAAARKGLKLNPHVAAPLLKKRPPKPPAIAPGRGVIYRSPDEAIQYANHAHSLWHSVPRAAEWLKGLLAD